MKIVSNIKRLSAFRFLIMVLWALTPLLNYFRIVWMKLPVVGSFSPYLIPTIIILCILLSIRALVSRLNSGIPFLFYIISTVVFLVHYVVYPRNTIYMDECIVEFLICTLPFLFIGYAIDIEESWNDLYFVSVISVISFVLFKLILQSINFESTSSNDSDMSGAYQLLPHLLFCLWGAFKKKNVFSISIVVLGFIFLLGQGNRGSLVSFFCFFIIYVFSLNKGRKARVFKLLAIVTTVIILINFDNINLYLMEKMPEYGFSVRVFEKFLNDEAMDSSGRDIITSTAINAIKGSPILGYGICADRWICKSAYAHNFFLEILIDFGPLIGSILLIIFLFYLLKGFILTRNSERIFLLLLCCTGFIPILFSGSYLTSKLTFFLIGYIIHINSNNHRSQIKQP